MVFHVPDPCTVSEEKSSLKTSRTTRTASSGSDRSITGAFCPFFCFCTTSSHCACRRFTSSRNCASVAPSAAVRTITPESFGTILDSSFFRRARSFSGSLREIPVICPSGTSTKKRPAKVICEVSRAPLCPIGSFVTCTRTVSPDFKACSMRRGLPWNPSASQFTSPAYKTALRPFPRSTNAASIDGKTFCTRPR